MSLLKPIVYVMLTRNGFKLSERIYTASAPLALELSLIWLPLLQSAANRVDSGMNRAVELIGALASPKQAELCQPKLDFMSQVCTGTSSCFSSASRVMSDDTDDTAYERHFPELETDESVELN